MSAQHQLIIETNAESASLLEELLALMAPTSITILPIEDKTSAELRANFDAPPNTQLIKEMCSQNHIPIDRLQCLSIPPQDWAQHWKQHFAPIIINDALCICPSWEQPPADIPTLVLDPGQAFGTGQHETTYLCLQWLCEHQPLGQRVLDYGCGTGILAMASQLLGARHVLGVDIDPIAIQVAKENLAQNIAIQNVQFEDCEHEFETQFDLLVANIVKNPILSLRDEFQKLLKPAGKIVLSGLLIDQADEVIEHYDLYFNIKVQKQRGQWCLLAGERRNNQ